MLLGQCSSGARVKLGSLASAHRHQGASLHYATVLRSALQERPSYDASNPEPQVKQLQDFVAMLGRLPRRAKSSADEYATLLRQAPGHGKAHDHWCNKAGVLHMKE